MRFNKTAVAAAVCTFLSSGAYAQQQLALEEVIVTATKRAESLQDIPVTVSALSENTIQEAGIGNLNDVAAQVPSLTVASNLTPFATAIRIRGFGTAQNDPSLEASVAFIIDGVYMGNSGLGMSDLTDIQRIEVLQGPQGTLYGKNSNAGVVSVVTKSPNTEEYEGFVEATVGNFSTERYTGSITGPINDDWAFLLSGSWNESDGWLDNGIGDDLNEVNDGNVRGKLLWEPTDTLSATLTASYVDRDTTCCGADALQSNAVLDELARQGLPIPENDSEDFDNNVNQLSEFKLRSKAANLTVNYELDSATLTSITAYTEYKYRNSFDGDRSQLDVLAVVDDEYTGDLFTQELRLAGDFSDSWQYIAGLFYANERRTRGGEDHQTIFFGDDIIAVGGEASGLGPLFSFGAQPGDFVVFDNKWDSETIAAFGQVTWEFAENWEATAGLRYSYEEKDADLLTAPFSTAALFGTGRTLAEQGFSPIDEQGLNQDFSGFTGLFNVSYFFSDASLVFISYSTGTKSGGFNGVATVGVDTEFDEEDTTNYELGIKTQLFDDRLQLNATYFYTEFEDLQFLAQLPNGIGFFVSNAAEGVTQGIDLNFSAIPWSFLRLSGGLQYLDAEFTEGELTVDACDVGNGAGPGTGAPCEPPQAANWSGNLAATFLLPVADGTAYFRTDYSYQGDHFTNATYQPDFTEQDRETLNFRLGWRNDNWDAAAWVNNATDDTYSSVTAAPIGFIGVQANFLTTPRTYGATVRYNF